MNLLALCAGLMLAVIIIVHFKRSNIQRSKYGYSLLLLSFPIYYFAFAISAGDYDSLQSEIWVGAIFVSIALLSVLFSHLTKFILLAVGYILHGAYDITHDLLFINKGTPLWWPEFCGVIDILIGGYLVFVAFKYRVIERSV